MEIKIEKNIPLPSKRITKLSNFWEVVYNMETGESFLLPKNVKENTIRGNIAKKAKEKGKEFTVRKTPDGLRVWCIK